MPDAALAAALRRLREATGRTQEQVAHDARITTGALSKIETATTTPSWGTVRQIADALGVSLADLVRQVERAE